MKNQQSNKLSVKYAKQGGNKDEKEIWVKLLGNAMLILRTKDNRDWAKKNCLNSVQFLFHSQKICTKQIEYKYICRREKEL